MPDEQPTSSVSAGQPYQVPPIGSGTQPYAEQPFVPQGYPPSNGYVPSAYPPQTLVPADGGLSDTAAGTLAYVTIIPAIIFLVLAPYNTRPFVKFHAFQCLGLFVLGFCLGVFAAIPILGWIIWILGSLALLIVWILSIVKASQGSYLKLPVITEFAAKQSGYAAA